MKDDYSLRGFETISVDSLDEYQVQARHLRHTRSGAELYHILADDPENLFSFTFKTPPSDHTGVAHILEHVVLCGSEHYPLKDPFLVLLKSSAYTFLNAMTYADKTVYPASSVVKADFLNLLRVYADAVFFPQLKSEAFAQEGHRLEFDNKGKLRRTGIVLNEMKGNYSSVESLASDAILHSLFPESPYRWDSGGNPQDIPHLTYENFKNFHKNYYHPSNARIFLYGDHDIDEILAVLDGDFLSRFDRQEKIPSIPLQRRWDKAQFFHTFWPSVPNEETKKKSTLSVNWLWGESLNRRENLSAQALSLILLGHGGAPLQKALIDSGLGEDLSPIGGLETSLRQLIFSVALRGTDPSARHDFEALVDDTLKKVVRRGLEPKLIEGSLRSLEFRACEIPRNFGMRLMKRALNGWLHDGLPGKSLLFKAPMAELRKQAIPGYFEEFITRELLNNTHRSTVLITPDPQKKSKEDAAEKKILEAIQTELFADTAVSKVRLLNLQSSIKKLEQFQETPDSPENLARIPLLSRQDLPSKIITLPLEEGREGELSWYRHDTFTNGVAYLDMAFDLKGIAPELQAWLPLFGRALTEVGLPGMSHEEVALDLSMKTGDLSCRLEASSLHPHLGSALSRCFFVRLKVLLGQWDEALDICYRLLTSADFSDPVRLGDLLREMRNDFRAAILPSGHAFAALRSSTKHSSAAPWEDLWYGIGQLEFLQKMADHPHGAERATVALGKIREALIRQGGLSFVLSTDSHDASWAFKKAMKMVRNLPSGHSTEERAPLLFQHESCAETLSIASAVSFSALSLPAPLLGTKEHAHLSLLAHTLRTGYLWEHIRMKGGAYGASASISSLEGNFTFSTYRDPFILPSLEVFRTSLEWIRDHLDDKTLDMAVVGSVGKELQPLSPGECGLIAFKRRLYGISNVIRQNRRDEQLVAKKEDLRLQAIFLLENWEKRSISVIAGTEALDKATKNSQELRTGPRLVLPS